MRAKLKIGSLYPSQDGSQEHLAFHGVCKDGSYGADGADEDNTFARFSPSVGLQITIANPELLGKFKVGETFYVDFTPVDPAPAVPDSAE